MKLVRTYRRNRAPKILATTRAQAGVNVYQTPGSGARDMPDLPGIGVALRTPGEDEAIRYDLLMSSHEAYALAKRLLGFMVHAMAPDEDARNAGIDALNTIESWFDLFSPDAP